MNPSMASLPLMVSGPEPEKAIASPKLTDFLAGAGGGGGGVAGEEPSVVGGSSEARTTTAANLLGRALVTDFMATDCIFVLGVVVCFVQGRRCALFFHLSYEDADIRNTQ